MSLSQISINPENIDLLKKKEGYGQEYFTDTTLTFLKYVYGLL